MSERAEKCKTCRFWSPKDTDAGGWGRCRRLPPVRFEFEVFPEGGTARVGEWPDTFEDDWCGEYRPAEAS